MKVTSLSAGKTRLAKKFTANGVVPYPNVSRVSSKEYTIDFTEGLEEFEDVIRAVSAKGGCLLKGQLTEQITDESRAGKTDRHGLAQYVVLDFDGIVLPNFVMPQGRKLTAMDMQAIAHEAIALLPEVFHNRSYIMQASASLGMKGSRLSFHLFFVLNTPVPPRNLKEYIKQMNFDAPLLEKSIGLSSTGFALTWPLDPSVADNSKLIFIATPSFEDVESPFEDDTQRIFRREFKIKAVDLAQAIADMPETDKLAKRISDKRKSLRVQQGMAVKNAVYKTKTFGGERHEVLDNPEQARITIADDTHLPFIRCNINGGDSGAYFFNVANPQYMGNFKGEPYFDIETADPAFYASIFENYHDAVHEYRKEPYPIVFRDFHSDALYNGLYNPLKKVFTDDYPLTVTSRGSLEGFMAAHGHDAPDIVPEARLVFDPRDSNPSVNLDVKPYYINMYQRTSYMLNPVPCNMHNYASAGGLQNVCPNIFILIKHALGGDIREVRHFINWLAFIYQFRQKTGTAWVLGGVQGTGKGLLLNRVLRPLLGERHVPVRTLENLEEQFNSYMQTALLVGVDEFRMHGSRGGSLRIADKLKNQITEPTITIRAMHSNQIEVPSYSNFIFLTNRVDAIKIEESDRRYSLGGRQEQKLMDAHPELINNLGALDQELYRFAGFLHHFDVNKLQATTALDNEAKRNMKTTSMSLDEEFCNAIKTGNLEFFTEILDITVTDTFNSGRILKAQKVVTDWIDRANRGDECANPTEDLRVLYLVQMEPSPPPSSRAFAKILERNNVHVSRVRLPSEPGSIERKQLRGIAIEWNVEPEYLEELHEAYVKYKSKVARA